MEIMLEQQKEALKRQQEALMKLEFEILSNKSQKSQHSVQTA